MLPLNPAVRFKAWAVNGRVPGPTLRCTVGDRLRILFRNQDSTSHSLHFHGIHPAAMDGIRPIRHGRSTVYEFDLRGRGANDLYAFNGIPNAYRDRPIAIYQGERIRMYLLNMIEWDGPVTFHLHANFFSLNRNGNRNGLAAAAEEQTDVITMGVAERHILEFRYRDPGMYTFQPHQDQIAERGCMGHFLVLPRPTAS